MRQSADLKLQMINVQPSQRGSRDKETNAKPTQDVNHSEVSPLVSNKTVQSTVRSLPEKCITLTFKDLTYSVYAKNSDKKTQNQPKYARKEILKSLTGICRRGELTAIMGASGAGKTTLLNVLSVRTTATGKNKLDGEFLANGQTYNLGKFSKFAGYVMQNDILFETMTPREIFEFTANLRLNDEPKEKKRKVEQLISDLQLEKAANTLVGGTFTKGISGGERKRTSIGVELITDPNLIFLDEPTSGLDSFTAFIIINLLKNLAVKGGKTIIFTIHQPSSDIFFLFDNLMILAKGKFIYQGSARTAVDYFGGIGYQCPEYTNPADYFIEVAHSDGNDDEKFHTMYESYGKTIGPKIEKEVASVPRSELVLAQKSNGFFTSCSLIAKRGFLNFVRNPVLLRGKIANIGFISFLICCLFFQLSKNPNNSKAAFDINGSLFFFAICAFMGTAMSVVLTFPSERAVFLREYSSNMYSVSSYFFGRSSVELPFAILFPTIMSAICYYIVGYNDYNAGKFFIFTLFQVFMSLAGDATGLLAGSAFEDPKVASNVVPAAILPGMIFSGFYINSGSLPVWLRWVQYISPFRYTLEGFMWNEYLDSPFGESVLDLYNFKIGLWGTFGLLAGIGLILRLLSLFALKNLVKKVE